MNVLKWHNGRLDLSQPVVMGILNLTPDSFYDGGKYNDADRALLRADKMIGEGASIIDVGAVSTRPFAKETGEEEEWARLKKVLKALRKAFPGIIISVDTFRASVAKNAAREGADMINDISGGVFDDKMLETVARLQLPYVLMHIRGTPATMQQNPEYQDVVSEINAFFRRQLDKLTALGVAGNIILDPGFGFGKSVAHNYEILRRLDEFRQHGFPLLAGLSRKSMINKILNIDPDEALNGTTVLNTVALMKGAKILRVHDVKCAVEAVRLTGALKM